MPKADTTAVDWPTEYIERIPRDVLSEMEDALLRRPKGLSSAAAIHRHFELHSRYGIGLDAFRRAVRGVGRATSSRAPKAARGAADEWSMARVPPELRLEVDRALLARDHGLESTADVHAHFNLGRLGVGLAQFHEYADLLCYRARLYYISQLVHTVFAGLRPEDDEKLSAMAGRMVIGEVITALAAREELDATKLARLSKILADQRTAALRESQAAARVEKIRQTDGHSEAPAKGLPPHFEDLVRDIYGLEPQRPEKQQGEEGLAPDGRGREEIIHRFAQMNTDLAENNLC